MTLRAILLSAALVSCARTVAPGGTALTFTGPGVEPDTLNPLLTHELDTSDFSHLYMPYLLRITNNDTLEPEIAAQVPTLANGGVTPDGKTITYHLKPNLKWQDGTPLTARDVAFTFRAIMNQANNVDSRAGYDQIQDVVARDSWTVIVRLKRPYSPIIAQFLTWDYAILPAHLLARYPDLNRTAFNSSPVGAGPYVVGAWGRGDRITFAANRRYWAGRAALRRLVYRVVPNANTASEQIQTGELDAWFDADPDVYPTLSKIRSLRITLTPMNDIHLLQLNLSDPTLRDWRVRKAVITGLNRSAIVAEATHGVGIPVDGDQPTFSWAYTAPKNANRYDPKRAATLLDQSGWKLSADGFRYKGGKRLELQLVGTLDVTGWDKVGVLVQAQLRLLGIALTLKTYPTGEYFAAAEDGGILRSGRFQIAYNALELGPDPNDELYYGCNEFSPSGGNDMHWCDPIADRAMRDALVTYDAPRRKRDYAVVQDEIAAQVPMIPLWEVRRLDVFHTPIKYFMPAPSGSTFWNVARWQF
jgi:peptide/nickel transport system substrate-binding protein